jgi:hypothetical protein
MPKKNDRQHEQDKREAEIVCPIIDKYTLVMKLRAQIGEAGDIAGYIDETVQYGRALGYAEGKHAAYVELMNRIFEGEFDPAFEEDDDGYEM